MTVEQLAGAIAVVKNLLLTRKIEPDQACLALWDLADSVCDSPHYTPGTSQVIDALLACVNVE